MNHTNMYSLSSKELGGSYDRITTTDTYIRVFHSHLRVEVEYAERGKISCTGLVQFIILENACENENFG